MKALLLLGFLFGAAAVPICTAQTAGFAVDLVNPSRAFLLVDDAWQQNAECLQVKVSVMTEVSDPVLKAYFYGADAKLLETVRAPSRETDGQGNQIKPQLKFEKGRKYELFFAIPEAAKKWKRAIIVFGNPGDYATKIYPKDDIAKFDFPEKASVVAAVPAQEKVIVPVQEKAMVATKERTTVRGKPIPEVQALKDPFDAQVNAEVEAAYDSGVRNLNEKYMVALERAQEKAQEAGKLDEAVAIRADREAVAGGKGVPATDDERTPATVKLLRSTYRQAIGPLRAERVKKLQPLQGAFLKSLDGLVVSLTKEGKLEEAMAVKNEREYLAGDFAEPAPTTFGQLRETPTPTPTTATKDAPFVNSLGMKFVTVPGTEVLMCIHETRRKDYAAFAAMNSGTDEGWKQAVDRGVPVGRGDDDPVVMVGFEDATAFCAWLSKKEGKVYRLPTDREWSLAVGIGDRESPNATPLSLNEKIRDEFPWGKQWPPPKGSVNLRDSSCGKTFPAANGVTNVEEYTDGFVTTAPVMSFAPNHLGIYDLGGNVWEWCSDWFEKDKSTHVMRGGNYGSIRGGVLSSYRIGGSSARTPGRGFRCVVVSQNAAAASQKVDEGTVMESEDLVVSGKRFTVGTLRNKELAYSNRGYVWGMVPESLDGARYTKIDGGVRPEIKVRAKRDTVVEVFNNLDDPGADLSGWDRTDQQFTFSNSKVPKVVVYKKKLSAGRELEIPQGNWGGALLILPPAATPTSAGAKAPELPWLIGKTWSTDAGNTLEFSTGGSGERITKSGKTPFTWRIMPSGIVEVVLKAPPPVTLYVEIKNASEGVFGYSEDNRTTKIHVK